MRHALLIAVAAAATSAGAVSLPVAPMSAAGMGGCGSRRADDTSQVYPFTQVDKVPKPYSGNPQPSWPKATNIETVTDRSDPRYHALEIQMNAVNSAGEASVVAQFIVDPDGCVDSSSFKVVSSTAEPFTRSVESVLPRLRYTPGQVGKQKVRTLLQWKFLFYRRNGAASPVNP